ncbi:MAG: hypothetical protein KGI06_05195 [Candidatus Micrarchaeota archaeon]|nr:hypothetical protein [Candidatus Micrarchaeota archaeon]
MEVSISAVKRAVRDRARQLMEEHRKSACERLEKRADREQWEGRSLGAGILYEKASAKFRKLGDKEKSLGMLLRAADNYEEYASVQERNASGVPYFSVEATCYLSEAMCGFAHAAYLVYTAGEPMLLRRARTLLTRAKLNQYELEKDSTCYTMLPGTFFRSDDALNQIHFLSSKLKG